MPVGFFPLLRVGGIAKAYWISKDAVATQQLSERVSMRERPHAFCSERGLKRNRRHEHDHAIIITDVTSGPHRMRPRKTGRSEISPIAVTKVFIKMHLPMVRIRGVVGVVQLESTPRADASYSTGTQFGAE